MNNNNKAISHWLLAASLFIIFNLSFSIFNLLSAQSKSSLQVDSINIKKVVATNLPIGQSTDSIITVMNGEVRKIPMPASMFTLQQVIDGIACNSVGGIITDPRDGNTYTVKNYGTAGCWMTQNLRYFVVGAVTNVNGTIRTLSTTASGTTVTQTQMRDDVNSIGTYAMGSGSQASVSATAITFKRHFDTLGVVYNWNMAMDSANTRGNSSSNAGTNVQAAVNPTIPSNTTGICPPGWIMPSDQDFINLLASIRTIYGITSGNEGAAMKSNSYLGSTASGGTNVSGWNSWLGGHQNISSAAMFGTGVHVWSSSQGSATTGYVRILQNAGNLLDVYTDRSKTTQFFTVRCKKQ